MRAKKGCIIFKHNMKAYIVLSLVLFWITEMGKYTMCTKLIRLPELENTLPVETASSDSESSLITCFSACHINIECRALFYNSFSRRCSQYTKFDYKKLRKEDNTSCHARYLTDVALGKPTKQSSMFTDEISGQWESGLAVDGEMRHVVVEGTYAPCTHTANDDYQPWWYVDLIEIYRILSVKLLTRSNNVGYRLSNVNVSVGLNTSHFGMLCANYQGPATDGQLVSLECRSHVIGRYVKVMKINQLFVSLCEFQVTVTEN